MFLACLSSWLNLCFKLIQLSGKLSQKVTQSLQVITKLTTVYFQEYHNLTSKCMYNVAFVLGMLLRDREQRGFVPCLPLLQGL